MASWVVCDTFVPSCPDRVKELSRSNVGWVKPSSPPLLVWEVVVVVVVLPG